MEFWDAYDKDLNKLGYELIRGKEVPVGVYHLVVEALIIHTDGSYLLMQRDLSKQIFPGVYEASAGGSALINENSITAITREVYEETGIDSIIELKEINTTILDNSIFKTHILITDYPKDKITLQEKETINYKWITKEEFIDYIKSNDNIPHQIKRLDPYIKSL